MKRVTLNDLAAQLGISTSTVSRALNGDRNIRPETRERVLSAAAEMGYQPNLAATSMKTGRNNTIGVVIPEMTTGYTMTVLRSIQETLYPKGFRVIVADSEEDPAREEENLLMMERFMVDGIIISPCNYLQNRDVMERLIEEGIAIVSFGRLMPGINISNVVVDDYSKSFFLVEKMILAGCRNICHFKGPEGVYNTQEREKGYRDALEKYKLEPTVFSGFLNREGGAAAVDRMIASGIAFDGIFAFNEPVGVGAMARLRELGKRIPEDLAVAAFSGTDLSSVLYPTLTTVEPPTWEIGKTCAELMMEKINNPDAESRTIVLNAEIKMRGSTERK